jgi:ABC-type iron transport system FetAB ATPase subunit
MTTRYYIANETDNTAAVYMVDGEYLAHIVPDWEQIEEADFARVWTTHSQAEAQRVANKFNAFGARVLYRS